MPAHQGHFRARRNPLPREIDTVTGPGIAYSLRKVRDDYFGSAVNIRRSSDNATRDIGFTSNGDFDFAALALFVTINTAFVTKWYDQSGNGYDCAQATAGNQPTLNQTILAGAIGSNYGITFASSKYLTLGATALTVLKGKPGASAFSVIKSSTGANQNIFSISRGATDSTIARLGFGMSNTNAINMYGTCTDVESNAQISGGAHTAGTELVHGVWNTATSTATLYKNGTQAATSASFSTANSTFSNTASLEGQLGTYVSYLSDPLAGDLFELLLYPRALDTAEQSDIKTDIGTRYGIAMA